MVEIDMLAKKQELLIQNRKKFITNPNTISSILSTIFVSGISIFSNHLPLDIVAITIAAFNVKNIYEASESINPKEDLINIIRETNEYKKCMRLYDEYITHIASFIKQFDLKESLNTTILLDLLLKSGYITYNDNPVFKSYSNEITIVPELTGARVVSGYSVCRHQSCFTKDVLNELGFQTAVLNVMKSKESNIIKIITSPSLSLNHAVVVIGDEDGKYIYDPTISIFAQTAKKYYSNKIYSQLLAEAVVNEPFFYYIGDKLETFNRNNNYNYDELLKKDYKELEADDIEQRREVLRFILRNYQELLINFKEKNKKIMKEITELEQQIVPHSDEEIKEYILHI